MRWRSGVMAIGAAICALGCPSNPARSQTGGPYAAEVADAIPRIEEATGLKFKRPPKLETRSRAEVRAFLEQQLTLARAKRDLAGTEAAYKLFGLLPDTMHLLNEMETLLTEQIVGFYDPKTKVLYIVDGAPATQVDLVITHELVHALQDQYINLDSLESIENDNDRAAAAQAVIEGQAVYDQLVALTGNRNFVAMVPGGWETMRQQIRDSKASMPALQNAPLVLQETLVFPYLSGAEFMRAFDVHEPGKEPYGDMPTLTTQILHFETDYFGHRLQPLKVTLPAPPAGWHARYDDNLGEFETRLLLFQYLDDDAASIRGATGWAGDRYEVLDHLHRSAPGRRSPGSRSGSQPSAPRSSRTCSRRRSPNVPSAIPNARSPCPRRRSVAIRLVIYEDKALGVEIRLLNAPKVLVALAHRRRSWWLVAGGWWLVAGGWWLVAGGWWLVAGGWWLANSE